MSLSQLETWVACCCEPRHSWVPGRAEALSSHGSGSRQIVVTAVPLPVGARDSALCFSCLHILLHFSSGLGASLLQPYDHLSPWWLSAHVLIHLPGIDRKLRDVTSGKHLNHFKRHWYSIWAILACQTQQARHKCPTLLHVGLWCV